MSQQLDIIVPCYNSEKTIQRCLEALLSQETQYSFRIIAVNNNSIDKTVSIIKKFPEVTLVNAPKQGRSSARNAGIKQSFSPLVAFIDSDAEADKNWIEEMCNVMLSSDLYGGGESVVHVAISEESDLFRQWRETNKEGRKTLVTFPGHYFPMLNTSGAIYRRKALEEVNFFDENLNSLEDVDLSKRVALAGYVLFANSKTSVKSYNASAHLLGMTRRYFQIGLNETLYNLKWSQKSVEEKICEEMSFSFRLLRLHLFTARESIELRMLRAYLVLCSLSGKASSYLTLFRKPVSALGHFHPIRNIQNDSLVMVHKDNNWVVKNLNKKEFFFIRGHGKIEEIVGRIKASEIL